MVISSAVNYFPGLPFLLIISASNIGKDQGAESHKGAFHVLEGNIFVTSVYVIK